MKYIEFRKLVKSPIFTTQLLRNLGASYTPSQLTNWQKKGHIVKLRGGLYAFSDTLPLSPNVIAPHLVQPSYISLATALSHFGIIPEAVFTTTCITTKGTRSYTLTEGSFTYQHLPPTLFFGYSQIDGEASPYYLAEPEKALLDYFYLTPSLISKNDILELRLNLEIIDWNKLKEYSKLFDRQRLNRLIKILEDIYYAHN